VLRPGSAPLVDPQRYAENVGVECTAVQPEAVLPSAIRTLSDMAVVRLTLLLKDALWLS